MKQSSSRSPSSMKSRLPSNYPARASGIVTSQVYEASNFIQVPGAAALMKRSADFDEMIARLDTALFKNIEAELNKDDQTSLLAIQKAVREYKDNYCYLEIGSHLGGSIQPHLVDPRCYRIYSIDKRPLVVPDNRGGPIEYPENSTQRMMQLLTALSPTGVSKIVCFDDDAKNVPTTSISEKPDICFIDGEHTNQAVVSDFEFCHSVVKDDGVICFHDSEVVWRGLRVIVQRLKANKIQFQFLRLGGMVSAIGLNQSAIDSDVLQQVRWSGWRYFVLHQQLSEFEKKHLGFGFIRALKPSVKTTLNWVRKLSS
jgi:hypothetical protein